MKRDVFDKSIQQHFQRIRLALADMRVKILQEIAAAAERDAGDVKKYNAEYLQERRQDTRNTYNDRISKIKNRTKETVKAEVAAVNMTLADWVSEPVSERLTTLLHLYTDFKLSPSRAEINLMRETAEGNYTGMKLINAFSGQHGVYIPCVTLEEMTKAVREMQSDAETCIDAYNGSLDGNFRYIADDLGLSVSSDDLKTYRPFAENYGRDPVTVEDGQLDQNDSLSRAESLFSEVMHTNDMQLTDGKRHEIDKLFTDCQSDDDRLSVAVNIMQTQGLVADLMPLYDDTLTKQALSKIAEDKRRSAAKSMKKFETAREEAARASEAATDASMAADRAAGDYSL